MEAFLENLKGVWSILAIIAAAVFTWLGWVIKAKIDDRKKIAEAEKRAQERQEELNKRITESESKAEKRQEELYKRLDQMIKLEVESNTIENKKLDRIAEGLDMALDCNEVIFESFHKSHIMNGESEAQRLKLREFRAKLAKEALVTPPENFNAADAFNEMLKEN